MNKPELNFRFWREKITLLTGRFRTALHTIRRATAALIVTPTPGLIMIKIYTNHLLLGTYSVNKKGLGIRTGVRACKHHCNTWPEDIYLYYYPIHCLLCVPGGSGWPDIRTGVRAGSAVLHRTAIQLHQHLAGRDHQVRFYDENNCCVGKKQICGTDSLGEYIFKKGHPTNNNRPEDSLYEEGYAIDPKYE